MKQNETAEEAFMRIAKEIGIEFVETQSCGHPVSAIVRSEEGTQYCGLCAKKAAKKEGVKP